MAMNMGDPKHLLHPGSPSSKSGRQVLPIGAPTTCGGFSRSFHSVWPVLGWVGKGGFGEKNNVFFSAQPKKREGPLFLSLCEAGVEILLGSQ